MYFLRVHKFKKTEVDICLNEKKIQERKTKYGRHDNMDNAYIK